MTERLPRDSATRPGHAGQRRRAGDRRSGRERRVSVVDSDSERRYSWEDQRIQYWTRLLFCIFALMYFNFADETQVRGWTSVAAVTFGFFAYGAAILFFMWHTRRVPHAPWRQRLTMWIDIVMASFAILADATLNSPGFLVYLMIILGNGMRYGLRLFGEAVVGCLGAMALSVLLRGSGLAQFTVSATFFLLFFLIIVLYSFSLTAKIESGRAKLARERNIDLLTGLLNRRALLERIADMEQDPGAHGGEFVVMFADLDRFKAVNDTHGHHIGDRVLAAIARRIAETVRGVDLVARYGGDEFILILPATSRSGGEQVAMRVRQSIYDWASENAIDVGVSIGMGRFPDHGDNLQDVIAKVDHAMYRSKLMDGRGGILHVDGDEVIPAAQPAG